MEQINIFNMRTLIICALLFLLVGYSQAQKNVNDNVFDPHPTIPHYVPKSGPRKTPTNPSPTSRPPQPSATPLQAHPPPVRAASIERELANYDLNSFSNKNSLAFCDNLAEEIRDLVASGRKINMIIVKGFADGKPNYGIKYDRNSLPAQCQPDINTETLNDVELARLRSCIIRDLLVGMIEPKYASSIAAWQTDLYDEPDNGLQGYAYRKVTVEIFLDEGE
jgi:hypothetical protein